VCSLNGGCANTTAAAPQWSIARGDTSISPLSRHHLLYHMYPAGFRFDVLSQLDLSAFVFAQNIRPFVWVAVKLSGVYSAVHAG
jgi:hypothetical protein